MKKTNKKNDLILKLVGVAGIIIVAEFVIFVVSLGSTGGTMISNTTCLADSGFVCWNPVMNTNGQLSFKFGQVTGVNMPNASIGCATEADANGLPLSNTIFESVYNRTNLTTYGNLTEGQIVKISNIQCYGPDGKPFNNNDSGDSMGTRFSGYLWVRYGASLPQITFQVAEVSVKVT
jgi:hypothetical protein